MPNGAIAGARAAEWGVSVAIYAAFSAAIFALQGGRPVLGSDHLSYMQLADSIIAACPAGDYWRETSSVKTFGVILAYLHGWTGSHVLSMKLVLALFSVLYLVCAEMFFRLFTDSRWRAVLFALLSAFAVSFGVASWGVTDSTALLPRTLAAPVVMCSAWWWFRFDGRPLKYCAFSILILGTILHLGTFFALGVLVLVELIDLVVLRRFRLDRMVPAFLGGLVVAGLLQFVLEQQGLSTQALGIQVPEMMRAVGLKTTNIDFAPVAGCRKPARVEAVAAAPKKAEVPAAPTGPAAPASPPRKVAQPAKATPAAAVQPSPPPPPPPVRKPLPEVAPATPPTAAQAWAMELELRPWRNMPLPLVNLANILSSSALILALAVAGIVAAWRAGPARADKLMLGFFVAVFLFSFGPQTVVWLVRSYWPIYPVNVEEIRALSLVMIPALYFILRLFGRTAHAGGPGARLKAGAVVVGVLALPLAMKGLPNWTREGILSTMVAVGAVNPNDASRMANARVALGLASASAPFFYSTQGVRDWLRLNAPAGSRVLTDRDDLVLLRHVVLVGPRQVGATTYYPTAELTRVFLETARAISERDLARVKAIARERDVDFAVVPWRVDGAAFFDGDFSIIAMDRS